jgi:hypothetical protein
MLPRLWQCAEPLWWEWLLGFPLSGYALWALCVAAPLARARRGRGSVFLPRLLLYVSGAMVALVCVVTDALHPPWRTSLGRPKTGHAQTVHG